MCLFGLLLGSGDTLEARTRFHEYTERFHSPPNVAKPMAAGYLGGSGDEYLAGAAFLEDGSLVLAGNGFGPSLEVMGVELPVLGTDRVSPDAVEISKNDKGAVKPLRSWEISDGAGFLVQLSPDYQRITRGIRFPWSSGVLTDVAVDSTGAVFVTGRTGSAFDALTPSSRKIDVKDFSSNGESFYGKLRPDWSGFEWCVRFPDDNRSTPALRYLGDGVMSWVGENGVHFNSAGQVVKSRKMEYPGKWIRGVDFITLANATGGMRHTRTGYEPWIQPGVHMYNVDGSYRFRTHEWDPQLAGTNFSRLISDSAPHVIAFDRQGELLLGGWSDGGNSVFAHVPFDLTRHMSEAVKEVTGRDTGLPFSTWGAGIGSFAHIVRMDSETAMPLNYTLFISYRADQNVPNSVTLRLLDTAVDNSLLLAGASAWGLIQTGSEVVNTLDADAGDYIGGDFVAVLNEDWNNIRYSSAVPGSGRVLLKRKNDKDGTGMGTDSVKMGNRTRVVFFGGAQQNDKFKPVRPVQAAFGGGDLDGLFVVLDMESLPQAPDHRPPFPTAGKREVKIGESDKDLSGSYMVARGMKNDHCVLVLRDATGKQWPTFYRGRPLGSGTVDARGSGQFTLVGEPDRVQVKGGTLNAMRVGGEEGREDFPELTLEITLTTPTRANVQIGLNGRTVQKQGDYVIKASKPTGKGLNVRGVVSATRGELGLATPGSAAAGDEILVEWWAPARPGAGGTGRSDSGSGASELEASEPAPAVDRNAMRTWTSSDGRKVDARLMHVRGDQVTIQRADGAVFTFSMDMLSEADQQIARP